MSTLTSTLTLGLDLGSSYVKAVLLDENGNIVQKGCCKTGYDYQVGIHSLIAEFEQSVSATGVTGYGRYEWDGEVQKTEISCMAKGLANLGHTDGCLVDIGGQDCKVLQIVEGKTKSHALNRRCAAGTGSYLEYLGFRLEISHQKMDSLAAEVEDYHPLNSFCTVFSSTEILDCMRSKVPLNKLIRGMYASIAERTREMALITDPLYLSGGVVEHHPTLVDVFRQVLGVEPTVVAEPQFLAATGAAIYAREVVSGR